MAPPPVEDNKDNKDDKDKKYNKDNKNKAVGGEEGFVEGVVGNILEFFPDVLLDGGCVGVLGKDHADHDARLVGDNFGADGVAEDIVFKDEEIAVVHIDAFQRVFNLLKSLDGDRDEGVGGTLRVEAVEGLRDTGGEDLSVGIDAELLGGAVLEAKQRGDDFLVF